MLNNRRDKGFTLIELMIVVAVVAVIMVIAVPSFLDQVRKARRSDAKQPLMDVAAKLEQYYQDFEEEAANLPNGYRPPEGLLLIAKYERQLAGCVALVKQSEGICEMKRLFVRTKYQRLGIGRALCNAIIEQAKKAGYSNMRLATALEMPKVLYKSLGFKEIAPFEDVPTEIKGVVFMELKLV